MCGYRGGVFTRLAGFERIFLASTATISLAVKAVLVALMAIDVLPWTDAQITAVALAVAAIADLAVYLGLVRPRVTPTANPRTNDGTPLVPAYHPGRIEN